MKFICLAVALLGVASAGFVPTNSRSLASSINQIKNAIPVDEIKAIAVGCADDPELVQLVKLLGSDVAQKAVDVFVQSEDVSDFVFWLDSKGVDALDLLNRIFALLGLNPVGTSGLFASRANCGGWRGFVDRIKNVVSVEKLGQLIASLWSSDPEFAEMMNKLQGAQKILQGLIAHSDVQAFLTQLKSHGVDTDAVRDAIRKLFGWTY